MCLTLRPNSNTRGLALLSAATSCPPLQPQMLKLEEVFEDSRRAGTDIQDAVKAAILMRCVSGQLKTYLNLGAQDDMSYSALREQCLKWDKAQQSWSSLVASDDTAVPMEIDRVEGKGWHGAAGKKGKGKGKSDKGASKGKSKSKSKSKDGKGKSEKGSDKGKGRADDRSKGKGKGDRQCYICGKPWPLCQGLLPRWTTSQGCCTKRSPTVTGQYGFLSDRGPRRCGAKHVSKSKCTKHTILGPLLEVAMSKKCTPLWREAHFQVKMYKTHHARTTFGGSDVEKVHAVVARSTFRSQKCKKLGVLSLF